MDIDAFDVIFYSVPHANAASEQWLTIKREQQAKELVDLRHTFPSFTGLLEQFANRNSVRSLKFENHLLDPYIVGSYESGCAASCSLAS